MTDPLTDSAMPLMPPSPGALIKAGRERAGVHLAVLSVNMKVTVKQLEALESDRFDVLSGPVFSRALAAKVCRFLKMDSQPVLDLMPSNVNGLKPLNIIGLEQESSSASSHNSPRGTRMSRGFKLWLWVLLLGLLTFAFGSEWILQVIHFNAPSQTVEVIPTMPPVQEPVAQEAAQTEPPKALVFDSPPAIAVPTASNAPANPNISTLPNVTSENLK